MGARTRADGAMLLATGSLSSEVDQYLGQHRYFVRKCGCGLGSFRLNIHRIVEHTSEVALLDVPILAPTTILHDKVGIDCPLRWQTSTCPVGDS